MNIAKKVRVTAFAIIVALSVLSYIMLGGGLFNKSGKQRTAGKFGIHGGN